MPWANWAICIAPHAPVYCHVPPRHHGEAPARLCCPLPPTCSSSSSGRRRFLSARGCVCTGRRWGGGAGCGSIEQATKRFSCSGNCSVRCAHARSGQRRRVRRHQARGAGVAAKPNPVGQAHSPARHRSAGPLSAHEATAGGAVCAHASSPSSLLQRWAVPAGSRAAVGLQVGRRPGRRRCVCVHTGRVGVCMDGWVG